MIKQMLPSTMQEISNNEKDTDKSSNDNDSISDLLDSASVTRSKRKTLHERRENNFQQKGFDEMVIQSLLGK